MLSVRTWDSARARSWRFGDSDNDLGMFSFAGTTVAMGNATPAIVAAATTTTTSQDQDGVAVALRRFISDGWIRR